MKTQLALSSDQYREIYEHLFPGVGQCEEGAFLYCTLEACDSRRVLSVQEMSLLSPDAFTSRSAYYLELTDETRARVMKRAHDLHAVLIEVHSHPHQVQAEFSPSDLSGFATFVPYVKWRLPGRPYAAVVHGCRTFDALIWESDKRMPGRLHEMTVDGNQYAPTGHTLAHWR